MVAKKYLTEQELLRYLKAAFDLQTIPNPLMKIKNAPTKTKICQVFYTYYKNMAGKPYRQQRSYAALLGDYFAGFDTDTVSSNLSK